VWAGLKSLSEEPGLLLDLCVKQVLSIPLAIFLELDSSLNLFTIFSAPVVDSLTFTTGQFYQFIL